VGNPSIPKKHYTNIIDIDNDTLNKIFDITRNLSDRLTEKLNCGGFTLIQNNGDIQEVKHFHLHIKPYYNNKQDTLSAEETYKTLND
jgi:histidine triad (HIT) family protein